MYTVLIVDDEPAAAELLCRIIEKRCEKFRVADTAENGRQALEKIKRSQPDLMITDVKMPVMDGVDLMERVHRQYPDIHMVVVSGYQDFEYVKAALRAGTCDYLLKPVLPQKLTELMKQIEGQLDEIWYQRQCEIVKKLCRGGTTDQREIDKYLTDSHYYSALIRKNALPRRFSGPGGIEVFSEKSEKIMIYGRDEMESMYLCPESILNGREFFAQMERQARKEEQGAGYVTAVISREAVRPGEIQGRIRELYEVLNRRIIPGRTQVLCPGDPDCVDEKKYRGEENALKALEVLLEHGDMAGFRKTLRNDMEKWILCDYPQLRLEKLVRQALYLAARMSASEFSAEECETLLEDAFYHALSGAELTENVDGMIGLMLGQNQDEIARTDSENLFCRISDYIGAHAAEPLTLRRMCSQFGVSQTYLSRLFRTYGNTSFVHYLTRVRMEAAKKLMEGNPGMYIRDIAELTGYSDQFYFSRIFRSVTGCSPSDYIGHINMGRRDQTEERKER